MRIHIQWAGCGEGGGGIFVGVIERVVWVQNFFN